MTWAQLRTFVAVADLGSVRAASGRLAVTQSAVSAALAALQREVGTPLVEREGRGLRLTRAGTTYAEYARRILGLLDEAGLAALGEADGGRDRLRVAAVTSAGEHLIPPLLARFRAAHPTIGVALEVGPRERVWALLADHVVDVAVAGRPPPDSDLVVRAVRRNDLIVVAGSEWADAPGRDVRDVPWLLREPGSGTRDTTEALLENLQADPIRLTLGSNGAVVAGVLAGLGVTLVSREAVHTELAAGRLIGVPVPGTPLDRPYHLVTHRTVPRATRLFLASLLDEAGSGFRPTASSPPRLPVPGGRPDRQVGPTVAARATDEGISDDRPGAGDRPPTGQ